MAIFTASGLRGIVSEDIHAADFLKLARVFGVYIREGTCAIARDTRQTGEMLSRAVAAGLLEAGCKVKDYGVLTTPALLREVRSNDSDGGLIVTASHNPPDWNGLKLISREGRMLSEEELNSVRSLLTSLKQVEPKSQGRLISTNGSSYVESLLERLGSSSCSGVSVAVDVNGGATAVAAPGLFRDLGCKVTVLSSAMGVFSHDMDPISDTLDGLREAVRREGCDVGFAFDCDGDRVAVVDVDGQKVFPDMAIVSCVDSLLRDDEGAKVVATVDTTQALGHIAKSRRGEVVYAKVGEANVVHKMVEEGAEIGVEGSSGGLILADHVLCRDGLMASGILCKDIKASGGLRSLLRRVPNFVQLRQKVPCQRELSDRIVEELAREHPGADTTDGSKIWLTTSSWILVRQSNTEHVLRISVEAPTKSEAEDAMHRYRNKIEAFKEGFGQRRS